MFPKRFLPERVFDPDWPRVYLKSGAKLKGMGREIIPAGDAMVLETAGGGGRGDPAARDPDRIASDRKNGLVL